MLPFASSTDVIYVVVTLTALLVFTVAVYLLARTQRPATRQPDYAIAELGGPVVATTAAHPSLERPAIVGAPPLRRSRVI